MLAWGASVLVMTSEKDLGSSLFFFVLFVTMLWIATERGSYLVVSSLLFMGGATLAWMRFEHVQDRVDAWIDPWADASGSGYQVIQASFSLANGGVTGTGPGLGRPDLIPEVERSGKETAQKRRKSECFAIGDHDGNVFARARHDDSFTGSQAIFGEVSGPAVEAQHALGRDRERHTLSEQRRFGAQLRAPVVDLLPGSGLCRNREDTLVGDDDANLAAGALPEHRLLQPQPGGRLASARSVDCEQLPINDENIEHVRERNFSRDTLCPSRRRGCGQCEQQTADCQASSHINREVSRPEHLE
jgi:hypothetical protein